MILVFLVPFATIIAAESCVRQVQARRMNWMHENFSAPLYLACSVLTLLIYLPLVAWLSLAIGLKVRTQARAMIGSMAAIVAWCVVPLVFVAIPLAIMFHNPSTEPRQRILTCSMLLSPASILFWNETESEFLGREFGEFIWVPVVLNFGAYLAALVFFRRLCLKNADRWLGRLQETTAADPSAAGGGPLAALRAWLGTMERKVQPETRAESQ
jgi:hypothetical protein